MITAKAKELSYNEAIKRLKRLQEDREDARAELEDMEERTYELEDEIRDLSLEIDELLDQVGGADLSSSLTTALLHMGFTLTDISMKASEVGVDLLGSHVPPRRRKVILEDKDGEIYREWDYYPSLSDLFDIQKEVCCAVS